MAEITANTAGGSVRRLAPHGYHVWTTRSAYAGRSDLKALVDDGTDGGPKASCLVRRPDKKSSPLHVTLTFSLPDGQHTWGIHVA
jgi:hypothetical protein